MVHLILNVLMIGFTRLFVHVVIGFLTGVTFWQLGNSAVDLQNRIFAIFQATVLPALIMSQVEPRYDMSRLVFIRESSSKMYSQYAFVISIVVAEIPYGLIAAVAVCISFYISDFSTLSAFIFPRGSILTPIEPVTNLQ